MKIYYLKIITVDGALPRFKGKLFAIFVNAEVGELAGDAIGEVAAFHVKAQKSPATKRQVGASGAFETATPEDVLAMLSEIGVKFVVMRLAQIHGEVAVSGL